jgi:hypothetical protein
MFTIEQPGQHHQRTAGVFKAGQRACGSAAILSDMICCAYCGRPATTRIVSHPEEVCYKHALEFWNGLLVYARDGSHASNQANLRVNAMVAVGSSPGDRESFSIGVAS